VWCARCMPASEAKWGRQQPNLSESGAWTPSNGVPFRTARYALKYWTNTVANVNILYTNFIRCDVLVACPHRKLNGVGSSKPNLRDRGAWTPSNGVPFRTASYALKYCTNTVANVNILYTNFIQCDVLVACPHRKLNGVGSRKPTSAIVRREHHRTACRFARIVS